MIKKKALLTIACLSIASTAFAGGPDTLQSTSKFHPYVSALAGRSIGSWTDLYRTGAVATQFDSRSDRLTGWEAYFAGGLTYDITPRFLMGLEFGYGVSNSKFEIISTAANANDFNLFKHYYTFGVLPGIVLNGQSLYTKLMASWAELKNASLVATRRPASFKQTQAGATLGLGVVAPINGYLAIRTEYDWSEYKKVKKDGTSGAVTFIPSQDAFLMGLNVYFIPQDTDMPMMALGEDFYVGFGGGRDLALLRRRQKSAGVIAHWDQGLSGAVARALFGYRLEWHERWSLAPEFLASYSSASYSRSNIANSANTFDYRLKDSYALRGKVGVNTSESNEIFALGGGTIARFEKTGGEQFGENFDRYKWGWQVGFGDEFAIARNFSLRFEGDYSRYERIATGIGNDGANYSWKPSDERATLTALYYFG